MKTDEYDAECKKCPIVCAHNDDATTRPHSDHPHVRRSRLALRIRAGALHSNLRQAGWNQRETVVEALWTDIEANLDALHLDPRKDAHLSGWTAYLRIRGADRPRAGQGGQQQPPVDSPLAGPRRRSDGHGRFSTADGRVRIAKAASCRAGGRLRRPRNGAGRWIACSSARCVHCRADCRHAPRGRDGVAVPGRPAPAGCAPVHRYSAWKRSATRTQTVRRPRS